MAAAAKRNRIMVITISVVYVLMLLVGPTRGEKLSTWSRTKEKIIDSLFPRVEVTLYNESDESILYMCSLDKKEKRTLRELDPAKQDSWNFTQFANPLYWCYLFVDEDNHGFFWVYGVRSRCIKCFWKIVKFPYLYRSDRNRWERQQLFPPQNTKWQTYKVGAN